MHVCVSQQMGPCELYSQRREEIIIQNEDTCTQLNPECGSMVASAGAVLDRERTQERIQETIERYGQWPHSGRALLTRCDLPLDLGERSQDRQVIDRAGPLLTPTMHPLTAPANAIPRWACKQLIHHAKYLCPTDSHRNQMEHLHREWFPTEFSTYYYEGLFPSIQHTRHLHKYYPHPLDTNSARDPIKGHQDRFGGDGAFVSLERQTWDYRKYLSIACVIPKGSYQVNCPLSDADPIYDISASTEPLWQESKYPPGTYFNGERGLKTVTLNADLVLGYIGCVLAFDELEEKPMEALFHFSVPFHGMRHIKDSSDLKNKMAYIRRFGVADAWRGLGISKTLVQRSLHEARVRGTEMMVLNCAFDNVRAQDVYRKQGFVRVFTKEEHYDFWGFRSRGDTLALWLDGHPRSERHRVIVPERTWEERDMEDESSP